jgi:type II secretory pathway component PulF
MTVRFRYRASTGAGEMVDGIAEVGSRDGLLEQLRRRHLHPVAIEELAPSGRRRQRQLGRKAAVTRWARNFAVLLGAGTPVDRALEITSEQASNDGLATVLDQLRTTVRGGADLSSALAKHPAYFPPVVAAMVQAGEASGAVDIVFEQMADHLEEVDELRAQVGSALLYPVLMAIVAGIGVAVMLMFVIPRFAGILEDVGGTLPLTSQILIVAGDIVSRFWWLILLGVGGIAFVLIELYRQPANRRWLHDRRLRWPVIGDLERKYLTARFARTLGLLLQNGLSLVPALRIARASVTNAHVAAELEATTMTVAEGQSLAQALRSVLPSLAVQMLAIGEESGRLEDMCLRIADTYDGEVRRAVRTAVALIEPAMIVIFGVLVGFVALAMLQAIYSINTNVF